MSKICPDCFTKNKAGTIFCAGCGKRLPEETSPLSHHPPIDMTRGTPIELEQTESAPGTAILIFPNGRLELTSGISFDLSEAEEFYVGRTDPASQWFPAIDLTPYGGETGGVSRRHARIFFQGDTPFVTDLDSTNGTFVNNKRLLNNASHPLKHKDKVRFGRLSATYYAE